MDHVRAARERLEQASDLPAVLEAACTAFEDMLAVIQDQQDRLGAAFAAFILAGASAANGRFAVITAPSLPRSTSAAVPDATRPGGGVSTYDAATALAGLSRQLASRLDQASGWAAEPADRAACAEAARHARALFTRFGAAPNVVTGICRRRRCSGVWHAAALAALAVSTKLARSVGVRPVAPRPVVCCWS